MGAYPKPVEELVENLRRLPGIGVRSAERIVGYLLERPGEEVLRLAENISALKNHVRLCERCYNLSDADLCPICADPSRRRVICVVEEVKDLVVIERTGFSGLYHVLGGRISTLDNLGPERIRIPQLLRRIAGEAVEEVIIATNPTPEGEDTAAYLSRMLREAGVRHSRIACGLPVGGEIEYADAQTLKRCLEGRRQL